MGFAEFLRAKGKETLARALDSQNPVEPVVLVKITPVATMAASTMKKYFRDCRMC